MEKQKLANKLSLTSTIATVIFHFICCGLPLILIMISILFGVNIETNIIKITHQQMTILLILSGTFLALSYFLYYKNCNGCCNQKFHKINKIILIIATLLYLIGVSGHVLTPKFSESNTSHETMQHGCH
ncbi:MAG: hypothetical protein ACK5N8_00330 [Alphaproteobacteria bacterium]